jgi:hypothetical protein
MAEPIRLSENDIGRYLISLEDQLVEILSHYCGERIDTGSEGAVETLQRIIRERDDFRKAFADQWQLAHRAESRIDPAAEIPEAPHEHIQAHEITHSSGAHRSQLMPHYASIDSGFLWRLAQVHTGAARGTERRDLRTGFHYHGGDLGYGRGNWHKGLPMVDTFGHLLNHLYEWKDSIDAGIVPHNDDLAAAAWNIEVLMRFEQEYAKSAAERKDQERRKPRREPPNAG